MVPVTHQPEQGANQECVKPEYVERIGLVRDGKKNTN